LIPTIDVAELDRRRQAGEALAIVDVREPWELAIAVIPGSTNIPLSSLPGAVGSLPADTPLVVVCHHGGRSAQATGWLRANGYHQAVNLDGGVDSWAREIDSSMARY
jgi:rhodanese-related sulfurtransferase